MNYVSFYKEINSCHLLLLFFSIIVTGRLRKWLPSHLVPEILHIPILVMRKDRLVWLSSANGEFTISFAWELVRRRNNISSAMKVDWNSMVPLKISFFGWRVLSNFLPLDYSLQRRGLPFVSRCLCCSSAIATVQHLFIDGEVARQVW